MNIFGQTTKCFIKEKVSKNIIQQLRKTQDYSMYEKIDNNFFVPTPLENKMKLIEPNQVADLKDAINIAKGKYSYFFSDQAVKNNFSKMSVANMAKDIKKETGMPLHSYFEMIKDLYFLWIQNPNLFKQNLDINMLLDHNLQLFFDMQVMQKYEGIIHFINKYPKSITSNELYNAYLNDIFKNVDPKDAKDFIRRLNDINRDYNVKIFLPGAILKKEHLSKAIWRIENELFLHQYYSKETFAPPPIININTASYRNFYMRKASGTYKVGGTKEIGFYNLDKVEKSIRHEFMHRAALLLHGGNDSLKGIAVYKTDKQGNILLDERGWKILDWDKCKFIDEFKKAGISEEEIKYAYQNKNEWLAIIATGDLNKISQELQNELTKDGMPTWYFKVPQNNIYTNQWK